MGDTEHYLKPLWNEIARRMKVDKVYLETHRDLIIGNKTRCIISVSCKDDQTMGDDWS